MMKLDLLLAHITFRIWSFNRTHLGDGMDRDDFDKILFFSGGSC